MSGALIFFCHGTCKIVLNPGRKILRGTVGAAKAAADMGLFDRVAAHRVVFFRKSKETQESLRPGSLRLVPRPEQLAAWKQDYQTMPEKMLFEGVPAFDEIIRVAGDFERWFNGDR